MKFHESHSAAFAPEPKPLLQTVKHYRPSATGKYLVELLGYRGFFLLESGIEYKIKIEGRDLVVYDGGTRVRAERGVR